MDGASTKTNMSEIRATYRTPLRILVPKLIKSRDDWKAKSDRRKADLKAAKVKIRDLSASRDRWRERTEQLENEVDQLRARAAQAENELQKTAAALAQLDDEKKN